MADTIDYTKLHIELEEKGYTGDQIKEIVEGHREGLDVSLYSNPKYMSIQMHQIRLGLLENLEAKRYANPEFDWFQMEEIRKGMKEGVNIEVYASPEISFDRMHQIRQGLVAGIDLSPFKAMDAGVLKELRLAILNRINIVSFINAGYDRDQLEAIRIGLEKKLDIVPHIKKSFRGVSIQEICTGLEHGVDVDIYAKSEYCWQQMRELRLGLEHMVDVRNYSNPYYTWQQMREIRFGLEDGLDTSYYSSLMYTAREMSEKRLALKNHIRTSAPEADNKTDTPVKNNNPDDIDDYFEVVISPDEMTATLMVYGNIENITKMEVLRALRDKGVCFGIQYDEIDGLYAKKDIRKPIVIAKGVPARDGRDGYYEFFFRTEINRTPKLLEDGSVDFRHMDWFESVEENQELARYHKATAGEKGMSVTGRTIPARKGREKGILTGKGFRRLADGVTYVSMISGMITLNENKLDITKLLIMEDVNLATGNVEFDGSILINGNVSSGAEIMATEDCIVKGFVESARITCGGNATLRQGMNASGNGFIHAGGDVMGCFFEATQIDAKGSIYGDYFLNCSIHACKKVIVKGRKGFIAGGLTHAEEGIRTNNLGNQAGLETKVRVGILDRIDKKENALMAEIKKVSADLDAFENAHREYVKRFPVEVRSTMPNFIKIESAVYTMEKEMERLNGEKALLEEEKKKIPRITIVVSNELHEGVLVEMDGITWHSVNIKEVALRRSGKRIAVGAIDSIEG